MNCKYHDLRSRCTECDLVWYCDTKYDTHWEQEHNLECDICQSAFAKESTLKYHNQEWYCNACEEKFVCYEEFRDHAPNLYHWTVKNLRPDYTAKIPLEAFEKVDEAPADGEHNVNVTLFKKPLIPTRPTEEIGTYSVLSKADHIDDLESPVDETDKVAKISPRAEIEGHEEQCDKEENGSNLEGKNEEENSEERKRDDTEQRGVLDNLENAYEIGNVQRASKGIFCKKRGKTVKSKKKLRRHIKKGHQTVKKTTCNSCDDTPNRRTDSRIHGKKFHEHDNDNEEGKNDEAKAEPNIGNIKKEKRMLV